MSRYIQQDYNKKPESKKEKPKTKAGQKGYDYKNLSNAKKIPTQGGYK